MGPGRLISFEGGESVGKTTQIEQLSEWIQQRGRAVTVVREPGGTEWGEAIRRLLLEGEDHPLPMTEVLLFAAARAELVARVIKPALTAGHVVLADRYVDSSVAYQSYGGGVPREAVLAINHWATDQVLPDLTILLMGAGYQREARDRMERRGDAFHNRVRAGYRALASELSRIHIVSTDDAPDVIHTRIQALVQPYLGPEGDDR